MEVSLPWYQWLRVKGEGTGAKLEPRYNLVDMKNVFMSDKDWYEMTLTNKGLIDAPFRLSSPNTTFGHFFSFSPEEGVVPPGACQTVKVTFSRSVLGTFSEDLLLTVKGQPHPHILNFSTSFVPLTFSLRVLGDGLWPPVVTCVQQLTRNQWRGSTAEDHHVLPKEFIITPAADTCPVMSQVTIKGDTVLQYSQKIQTGAGGRCGGCWEGDHDSAN